MRPLLNLALILLAGFAVFAAVRQTDGESVQAWFGDRPQETGTPVSYFDSSKVTRIVLSAGSGKKIFLTRADVGWQMHDPETDQTDRADAVLLSKLIAFSQKSVVVNSIPRDEMDLEAADLRAEHVRVRIFAGDDEISDYLIGRTTPWKLKIKDSDELMPTVYLRHTDSSLRKFVYVVSDPVDVAQVFEGNFAKLFDHKPLFFDPDGLEQISIESSEGFLSLQRNSRQSAWDIVKPLKLRTDPAAIKAFTNALFQLKAESLIPAATEASEAATTPGLKVSIKAFGIDQEQTMTLSKATDTAGTVATVSTRDVGFALPAAAMEQLDVSLDDLRYKFISNINPAAIQSIRVDSAAGGKLLLDRPTPRSEWNLLQGTDTIPVDILALGRFFESLVSSPVAGFPADTAPLKIADDPDYFEPFGLKTPDKRVVLSGFESGGFIVSFGRSAEGKYYAHRSGRPHIYELSYESFSAVPGTLAEWRDKRLWTLSRVDLKALSIEKRGGSPLELKYNFLTEDWKAMLDGENVFPRLDLPKALKYLRDLETIRVVRWLPSSDETALAALRNPVFRLTLLQENPATREIETSVLSLARASSSSQNRLYYGILSNEPMLFLIDLETAKKLGAELLQ